MEATGSSGTQHIGALIDKINDSYTCENWRRRASWVRTSEMLIDLTSSHYMHVLESCTVPQKGVQALHVKRAIVAFKFFKVCGRELKAKYFLNRR